MKHISHYFFIFCLVFSLSVSGLAFAETTADVVTLDNPLGSITTVPDLAGNIIKTMMGVMGSLTLLAFVYGSFLWLTSAGEAEKITTGKNTMLYAMIGIFVF